MKEEMRCRELFVGLSMFLAAVFIVPAAWSDEILLEWSKVPAVADQPAGAGDLVLADVTFVPSTEAIFLNFNFSINFSNELDFVLGQTFTLPSAFGDVTPLPTLTLLQESTETETGLLEFHFSSVELFDGYSATPGTAILAARLLFQTTDAVSDLFPDLEIPTTVVVGVVDIIDNTIPVFDDISFTGSAIGVIPEGDCISQAEFDAFVDAATTRLDDLEALNGQQDTELAQLMTDVLGLLGDVAALVDNNDVQDAKLLQLMTDTNTLMSQVGALQASDAQQDTKLTQLMTDLAGVQTDLAAVQTALGTLQAEVADLVARVEALESGQTAEVVALQTAVSELQERVAVIESLPDIMRRLESLEAQIL